MPLSKTLRAAKMTYPCPHCGHRIKDSGSWFWSIRSFDCPKCAATSRITYADKLALFERYLAPT